MAYSAEFPISKCLRSCNNHLRTFPVCVLNTGNNDVMYLACAESYIIEN